MSTNDLLQDRAISLAALFGDKPISGIYKFRHIPSGKVYIGQSVDICLRLIQHYQLLVSGSHHAKIMQEDFSKDGISAFEFEIVEVCSSDKATLTMREGMWIDRFDSQNSRLGYNTTRHGSPEEYAAKEAKHKLEAERERRRKVCLRDLKDVVCYHCRGIGVLGPMKTECPVCRGYKTITRYLDKALHARIAFTGKRRLPDADIEEVRAKASKRLSEFFPPPTYLDQS